jgi:Ca-activated chloride channel family protein
MSYQIAGVLAWCVLLSPHVAPGQQTPTFRSDVRLVLVPVRFIDKSSGRLIDDISRKEVEIFEDGIAQDIRFFERVSVPLDILLLISASRAHLRDARELGQTIRAALDELDPNDRVAVAANLPKRNESVTFSADRSQVSQMVLRALSKNMDNGERVYDGIISALRHFPQSGNESRRRVLVSITEDHELYSRATEKDVLAALLRSEVGLEGIILRSPSLEVYISGGSVPWSVTPLSKPKQYKSIWELVKATGGEVLLQGQDPLALRTAFSRVRNEYLIGYYPSRPQVEGEFRMITVRLNPLGALGTSHSSARITVRHKTGYYGRSGL